MIITCKNCNSSFNLDESLLKPTGSEVRCSKCANIFTAYPETITDMPDEKPEEIYTPELEDVKEKNAEKDVSNIEEIEEEAITKNKSVIDEFDLSDLKLEDESEPEETPEEPEELELELELDTEPLEKIEEEIITENELDLSEIGEMLVLEDQPKPEDKEELEVEEKFDLSDIDLEDKTEAEETEEEPEELNLGLNADMELVVDESMEEAAAAAATKDIESEIEDIDQKDVTQEEITEEEIEKEITETVALETKIEKLEAEEIEEPSQVDKEAAKEKELITDEKKHMSTLLLILLIVVLLAGGAYGTYVVLDSMNIKIPFISSFLKPEIQDPGNLKITVLDINGKFADNTKIGNLFVITGRIKNKYSKARSFIKITGKLYTKEKAVAKSATVYCGNAISDTELANLDINEINKRLSNQFGANKTNVNIKPGKLVPFMIIFTNIPNNIEEYTVEVTSSSPA
ncbi:MAG: zinc-ribbon domain-containing protein [Deltaproteobacteria bacterium]|nr:zinc-ribbon domain-containing protein [Deltaproteobacteria bacterium]MBW2661281.1 zinc-ribbon domain-containing protein [Deltaproteobacteria bacterium]